MLDPSKLRWDRPTLSSYKSDIFSFILLAQRTVKTKGQVLDGSNQRELHERNGGTKEQDKLNYCGMIIKIFLYYSSFQHKMCSRSVWTHFPCHFWIIEKLRNFQNNGWHNVCVISQAQMRHMWNDVQLCTASKLNYPSIPNRQYLQLPQVLIGNALLSFTKSNSAHVSMVH